ncbi:MAG: glycosyl hydrolase family 18 protein [Clostridia bacterium]|nr:glycosyl hydrolase family 18 protein [Clostridia bacterium]
MFSVKRKKLSKVLAFALCLALMMSIFMTLGMGGSSAASAPEWKTQTNYAIGSLVTYQSKVYECTMAHQSMEGWEPPNVAALWKLYSGAIDTPTPTKGATSTPTPTSYVEQGSKITGYITIDFVYSASAASKLLSGFRVDVAGTTLSAVTNDNGYFEISNVPNTSSNYTLNITKAAYLKRIVANVPGSSAVVIVGPSDTPMEMWAGDMNQDGAINMTDIVDLINYFNTSSGDGKYNLEYDLNKDGAVNMADILIIINHFNKVTADYPQPKMIATSATATPTQSTKPTDTPTPTNSPSSGKYEILTWVAAYNVDECMTNLQANYGGKYNPSNTLTTVAGQFFRVEYDGTVSQIVSDSDLQRVKNYCNSNGIKFFLCIFNHDGSWNWGRAASAFATNKTAHINNIVNLIQKVGADGIDIDYEGNLSGEPNRAEFATFINELGGRLHSIGKKLSVDTFAYIWNQPSQNWWGDWKGSVDFINNMGYGDLYGGGTSYHAYSQQLGAIEKAGFQNNQLTLGFPGWMDTWGSGGLGTDIVSHINEVLSAQYTSKPMSICIWDAAYTNGWKKAPVWEALYRVRTAN